MEDRKITKEEVGGLKETVAELLGSSENSDMFDSLEVLLEMNDTEFEILAPGFTQAFQKSVNNPNDKIILTQALNASGSNSEQLINSFTEVIEEIDKMEFLSKAKQDFIKEIIATLINAISDTEGISKKLVQVAVEMCHPDAKLPEYANITDSGMDLFALEDYEINPGETLLIPTGIKVALPPGYELQVRPKSGRCLKSKLRVANTPGTIDAGYRDEIKVVIENIENPIKDIDYEFTDEGKIIINSILHGSIHTIGKGEKFAQLVLMEVPKAAFYQVETVQEIGEDRGGGFGSTGLL